MALRYSNMLYADYEYYVSYWAGTAIPSPEEYIEYANKAQRYLDYVTQHRITDITTQVKNAVCSAAEELYKAMEATANIPSGIKSESNDGVSVTYTDTIPNTQIRQRKQAMYQAIEQELSGTGLLYRGC